MKRLIVCADGTWNRPEWEGNEGGGSSTNVLKMLRALHATTEDDVAQVRYYIRGVGTRNWYDRLTGGAFGAGLSENVLECYRFLANNYCPGDEIYIFGFSRGAFTARSLAGLIGAIGFIHSRNLGKLVEGWRFYKTPPAERGSPEVQMRLSLAGERVEHVPIKCIGVWDTVGSLGIPVAGLSTLLAARHGFHDVKLGRNVEVALHALALDERRQTFAPTLWDTGTAHEGQTVEQVWFPGVHANVGGGYSDQGLSDMALAWMIERVRAHTDLGFDDVYIDTCVKPRVDATLYDSRTSYWRVLPAAPRTCPPNTRLHPSVEERRRATVQPAYDPPNLPRGG